MRVLLVVIALLILAGTPAQAAAPGLTIFAAASLTDAFRDIGNLWRAKGHKPITFSFASSSTLALQIQHGAPADIFASADELWMDKLQAAHRIEPDTRQDFAANTLVLVERKAGLKPVTLAAGVNLNAVLGAGGRLAVGDPAHVPAGIYAEQALRKLGIWDSVQARLAPADSVRSALMLVESGEAPAGVVYGTDVKVDRSLAVAGTFPADSHDPILYPVALVAGRHVNPEAATFLAFLHTMDAQDVLHHYGFLPPS
jgi:molybdate transport system substrate-binding protein